MNNIAFLFSLLFLSQNSAGRFSLTKVCLFCFLIFIDCLNNFPVMLKIWPSGDLWQKMSDLHK